MQQKTSGLSPTQRWGLCSVLDRTAFHEGQPSIVPIKFAAHRRHSLKLFLARNNAWQCHEHSHALQGEPILPSNSLRPLPWDTVWAVVLRAVRPNRPPAVPAAGSSSLMLPTLVPVLHPMRDSSSRPVHDTIRKAPAESQRSGRALQLSTSHSWGHL